MKYKCGVCGFFQKSRPHNCDQINAENLARGGVSAGSGIPSPPSIAADAGASATNAFSRPGSRGSLRQQGESALYGNRFRFACFVLKD
jgi:hypothetical protein